ncbi:MAG: hypothetical protein K0Q73_6274 [Paenibacillus sp.]|nr:hypothetical protein [Paenibacillus sp.]
MKLNMVQFGLGPIGMEILKMGYHSPDVLVIGAVDVDPDKIGKNIGALAEAEGSDSYVVSNINSLPSNKGKKVAIHATGSNLVKVWPQIRELLDHGFSVVSTCEELSYPFHRYPELAKEINEYAKQKGQIVIGTGVNPGFIMDTMVLCLTAVTKSISKVTVSRKVDVSKRRIPLQKKVGIGMTKEEFEGLARDNKIGHVGLEESLRLIAYGLNWEVGEVNNQIEPTVSSENVELALTALKVGQVSGLHQVSTAKTKDGKEIILDLVMSVGVQQADEIIVEGDAIHRLLIPDGIFGDTATSAIAINCAKLVNQSNQVGLLTMADLGLPRNIHNL